MLIQSIDVSVDIVNNINNCHFTSLHFQGFATHIIAKISFLHQIHWLNFTYRVIDILREIASQVLLVMPRQFTIIGPRIARVLQYLQPLCTQTCDSLRKHNGFLRAG